MKLSNIKKGDLITYTKEIMFKGKETRTAKVILVTDRKILLEDGTEFYKF